MLFGEGSSYDEACRILDVCMKRGVDFFDSAEMYPVPQRAETQVVMRVVACLRGGALFCASCTPHRVFDAALP